MGGLDILFTFSPPTDKQGSLFLSRFIIWFGTLTNVKSDPFKVSATLKIAIFPYFRFQRFQIDMLESFLLKKKLEENIISVQRYRG